MEFKIENKDNKWYIDNTEITNEILMYWKLHCGINKTGSVLYVWREYASGYDRYRFSMIMDTSGNFSTRIILNDDKIISEKHKQVPVPVNGKLNVIFKHDKFVESFAYFTDSVFEEKLKGINVNKINSFPNKKDDGRFIIQNNKWEIFSNYIDTPNSISFKAPVGTKVRIDFDIIEVEYPKNIKPIERWIIIKENNKSVMYLNHGKLTEDIINAVNNVEFINLN